MQCVYCGAADATTRDHVPPECLFAPPRPSDLVTVPSCRECNSAASKDDEYFRLALSLRADVFDHPDAKVALASSIRSLAKPRKRDFSRRFLAGVRQVVLRSPTGLHLGTGGAYDVDLGRLDRVVSRIVRGLYYREKGVPLPADSLVTSWTDAGLVDLDPKTRIELQRTIIAPAMAGPARVIGNNVLRYWVAYDLGEAHSGAWVLRFYDKVDFLAMTLPPESLLVFSP